MNLDKKDNSVSHEWFYIRACDVEICLVLSCTDSGVVASSLRHHGDWSDNCSSWQIVRILVTMEKENQVESEEKTEVVKAGGTLKVVKHRR